VLQLLAKLIIKACRAQTLLPEELRYIIRKKVLPHVAESKFSFRILEIAKLLQDARRRFQESKDFFQGYSESSTSVPAASARSCSLDKPLTVSHSRARFATQTAEASDFPPSSARLLTHQPSHKWDFLSSKPIDAAPVPGDETQAPEDGIPESHNAMRSADTKGLSDAEAKAAAEANAAAGVKVNVLFLLNNGALASTHSLCLTDDAIELTLEGSITRISYIDISSAAPAMTSPAFCRSLENRIISRARASLCVSLCCSNGQNFDFVCMSPGNKCSFVLGLCCKLRLSASRADVDNISAVLLPSAEDLRSVNGAHNDKEALRVTNLQLSASPLNFERLECRTEPRECLRSFRRVLKAMRSISFPPLHPHLFPNPNIVEACFCNKFNSNVIGFVIACNSQCLGFHRLITSTNKNKI
jgi:hypothetical protein